MKETWINSELYIKSYEFSIFRDFFWIFKTVFLILFLIFKPFLINKKNKNWARGPRGCNVACKATCQRHADPRSAYVARYTYNYLFTLYNKVLWPSLYGKGHNLTDRRVL